MARSELFRIWGALFRALLAGLLQAIVVVIFREIRLVIARDARVLAEAQQAEEEGAAVDDRRVEETGRRPRGCSPCEDGAGSAPPTALK